MCFSSVNVVDGCKLFWYILIEKRRLRLCVIRQRRRQLTKMTRRIILC